LHFIVPIFISLCAYYLLNKNISLDFAFQYIDIFKIEKDTNLALVLINKIIIGYLIYQTLISIRKDTKEL
jgi:hypothetical protein